MARAGLTLRVEPRGWENLTASIESAAEALAHAHADAELFEIVAKDGDLVCNGTALTGHRMVIEADAVVYHIRPGRLICIFAAQIMAALPSRARLTWREGWPMFHCPPNDDRDVDNDPTPLVPNELVPA